MLVWEQYKKEKKGQKAEQKWTVQYNNIESHEVLQKQNTKKEAENEENSTRSAKDVKRLNPMKRGQIAERKSAH